ncbi:motility associated factor glycosyltransferase family protein [Endothiovibrio diazotrophicus]
MAETRNAEPIDLGAFLTNPHGEEYLYTVNRSAFANTASKSVFDAHFADQLFREDTLYLISGSDSGLLIRHLLNHDPIPGTRYLVIELPEVLSTLEGRLPDLQADRRVVLAGSTDWTRVATEQMDIEGYLFMGKVRLIRSIAAIDGHYTNYVQLAEQVKDVFDQWEWSTQAGLGQETFINAQMANLAENRISTYALRGLLDDLTCVLLAGGPSLDQTLPWVKENRDKLVVMAISRVCEQLYQEGITPDIIFVIDPHPAALAVSQGIYRFAEDALLLHAYHVYPPALHQWSGISGFIGYLLPWQSELNPDNFLVTAPTVTNTALTVAIRCGAREVILAGVDLCYTVNGYTHASGSAEFAAGPSLAELTTYVETNDGSRAETNHAYKNGVATLAQQVEQLTVENPCKVINPAPHAAKIPGVHYLPLERIELQAIPAERREAFRAPFAHDSREERLRHLQKVLTELFAMRRDTERVKELTDDALKAVQLAFDAGGKLVNPKQKKELDRIERRLDDKYKRAARLIKTYSILAFTRALRPGGKEWTEKEMKSWANAYYGAYRSGAERVLSLLDSTMHRIELRIEEELPDADLLRLSGFWLKEKCPGRIEVFRKRRGPSLEELSARYPIVSRLHETFLGQRNANQTMAHAKHADFTDHKQLLIKARTLFSQQNLAGTERLAAGLGKLDDPELDQLKLLVDGHLAELRGESEPAIDAYYRITDPELLEESLSRLCNLLLDRQDYDNALLALEALTHLSPTYMPQHAELLRLTGATDRALDEYARYFGLVPNDTRTMFKLAQLYRDLGSREGAQVVLEHILEHEPENRAALAMLKEIGE